MDALLALDNKYADSNAARVVQNVRETRTEGLPTLKHSNSEKEEIEVGHMQQAGQWWGCGIPQHGTNGRRKNCTAVCFGITPVMTGDKCM